MPVGLAVCRRRHLRRQSIRRLGLDRPSAGAWTSYALPADGGISCPTTSFCALATVDGFAATSDDPAAGPSSWRSVLADPINCTTATGVCGTEQIIASDRTGIHILDTSTELETGPQLTGLALTDNTLSWSDHGSLRTAQLQP